jgi:hypothetical protein
MPRRTSPASEFALLVMDLCHLRRGPDEMPYSPVLLALLIVAGVLLDVVTGRLLGAGANVLLRSLVSTAVVLALCWIALRIRRLENRYVQTASALVACSIVFSLLVLPLAWLSGPAPATPAEMTPRHVLLSWAMLGLIVWNLVVVAHIVRRALEAPFGFGLALALAWAVAAWALGQALFDGA